MRGLALDLIHGKVVAVVFEVVPKTRGRSVRLEVEGSIFMTAVLVYPSPGIIGGKAVFESEMDWPSSCRSRKIDRKPPTVDLRSTFSFNDKLELNKSESITAEMVSRVRGEILFLAEAILPTRNSRGGCAIAQLPNLVQERSCWTQAIP